MSTNLDATSAGGVMGTWQRESMAVLIFASLGSGTTTGPASAPDIGLPPALVQRTTAGAPVVVARSAGPAISELRRISGLTWDQLARLFGVSRRSLHFWASGKAPTAANEEHLHRLLAITRKIDRGTASENRAALLAVSDEGAPFDLLAQGQYDRVVALLGEGPPRRFVTPKLSDEALRSRKPSPPEAFLDSLQDKIKVRPGRLLASKPIRTSRRT
jgi:DNA-binding transcriptional regulator YiaG